MVCYVAHRCYCQLVRGLECSYVVSCWKYDVRFSHRVAVVTEAREAFARTCIKIVWKFCQRVTSVAEVVEVGARACVKVVWKLCQRVTFSTEVGEVGRCVSVASVIVNEVEALQYAIVSAQTI